MCTILNTLGALYIGSLHLGIFSSFTADLPLSRPNQFIGLDRVNRSVAGALPPPSFVNYPVMFAQVNTAHPRSIMPYGLRSFPSEYGTIVTDDRFFSVNSTVSFFFLARML
jgi:hypothetical protein